MPLRPWDLLFSCVLEEFWRKGLHGTDTLVSHHIPSRGFRMSSFLTSDWDSLGPSEVGSCSPR